MELVKVVNKVVGMSAKDLEFEDSQLECKALEKVFVILLNVQSV